MAQLRKYNSMTGWWEDVDFDKNILHYKDLGYTPLYDVTYSFNADNPTTVIPLKVEFFDKIYVPSTGVQRVSSTNYYNSLIDSTSDLTWNYSNNSSSYTQYSTLTTSSPTSYYLYSTNPNTYCGCSTTAQKPDSSHLTVQLYNTATVSPYTFTSYTITDPGNTYRLFVSNRNMLYTSVNTPPLYVTDDLGNTFEIVLPNGKNTYYNAGTYDATITIPQGTYYSDITTRFYPTLNVPANSAVDVNSAYPNWQPYQGRNDISLYQYRGYNWYTVS